MWMPPMEPWRPSSLAWELPWFSSWVCLEAKTAGLPFNGDAAGFRSWFAEAEDVNDLCVYSYIYIHMIYLEFRKAPQSQITSTATLKLYVHIYTHVNVYIHMTYIYIYLNRYVCSSMFLVPTPMLWYPHRQLLLVVLLVLAVVVIIPMLLALE